MIINILISMNIVGNVVFKRDLRSIWDLEENKINSQFNEMFFGERMSLELMEYVVIYS